MHDDSTGRAAGATRSADRSQTLPNLPDDWTERYLALLGIEHPAPSLDNLTRLVRAHVLTVPFENVTSHLRRRAHPEGLAPNPDPKTLLDAWERRAAGGVCFDIAAMAEPLLLSLGYDASLILAHISGPFGHQAIVVRLDGRRYLLDLGIAVFAPIPLDEVVEAHHVGVGFRFRPSDLTPRVPGGEEWIRDRWSDQGWVQGCRYELGPAASENRDAGYQHHMTLGTTWVLGSLTMNRATEDAVYALKDDTLVTYTAGGKQTTVITNPAEYRRIAAELYGLPSLPIEDGLAALVVHRSGSTTH
jgi:N-hydroxyarylamine O-acetyltransferase